MSESEHSIVPEGGDQELDELLDEAIQDFESPATEEKTEEQAPESTSGKAPWDDEFVAGAQKLFEQNLKALFEAGKGDALDPDKFEESLRKVAEETSKVISESSSNPEFSSAIADTLRNLSENADLCQVELNNDITSMLGNLNLDSEGTPDIFPFMHSMMQSFLSKEVVYPCIKEMTNKYPSWLEEHRSTLTDTESANYDRQYRLMRKVCAEYENETDTDGSDVKKKRFARVLSLMEEMQTCGQPPQDLLGIESPLPSPDGASSSPVPGMDNCSVM